MTIRVGLSQITILAFAFLFIGCGTPSGNASKPSASGYGPLTFNRPSADFYIAQDGRFVRAELAKDGAIDFYLKNSAFSLGHNGRQLNLALAEIPITEISTDPKGYKASRLSGPMAGSRERNSDVLLVYSGKEWSDGNTEFSDETSMKAPPLPGFQSAYQVNQLDFLSNERLTLKDFKGTLYGFVVVYKQKERMNKDIMPVRLNFN